MRTPSEQALVELCRTWKHGFLTSESCGPRGHFQIVCKFQSLEDMQTAFDALAKCGEVGQEIQAEEEAYGESE